MIKFFHFIIFFIYFAAAGNITAFAQSDNIAVRNDDRFTAKLSDFGNNTRQKSNEFIQEIEMEIQWWSLMGQPVYKYGFKWVPSGEYKLGDGRRLTREQLTKYPDLQARFDDMRPSQIEVAFDIKVSPRSTGGTLTGSTDRLVSPNYYSGGSTLSFAVAKGSVTTSSFLIGKPNQMMQDFSSGSPREWKDFVDWYFAEDDNVKAQNTFREARSIEFTNLRITKITPPDITAKNILDTYERRETEKIVPDKEQAGANEDDPWAEALGEEKTAPADIQKKRSMGR